MPNFAAGIFWPPRPSQLGHGLLGGAMRFGTVEFVYQGLRLCWGRMATSDGTGRARAGVVMVGAHESTPCLSNT
jgi:hypothetical protein